MNVFIIHVPVSSRLQSQEPGFLFFCFPQESIFHMVVLYICLFNKIYHYDFDNL